MEISDIIKFYEEGLDIKLRRKPHPDKLKGDVDYEFILNIYLPDLTSKEDLEIAILHEFVHFKNYLYKRKRDSEEAVEKEARKIYQEYPFLIEFIKDFYDLKIPKKFR